MHVCEIPVTERRRRWWTCEACGQLWHRVAGHWRMQHPEADRG